ncbi:MAG TPA: prolipoprotein diacylglyceryl transferase, partial [Campylobacterales bacterium]|nr:prolipoprotein diacylglyceryl transferase [Campylobacterales bacterium]
MDSWQHIYSAFDPVAFNLFGIPVHWYGIMYV